jgi:hypothetical protein
MVYQPGLRPSAPVLLLVAAPFLGVIGHHSHAPDPFPTQAERLLGFLSHSEGFICSWGS